MIKEIMAAIGTNSGAMLQDLMNPANADKLYTIPLDDEAVDKALSNHLGSGKHKALIDKILKKYAALLKKEAKPLREEWGTMAAQVQQIVDTMGAEAAIAYIKSEMGIDITEAELTESLKNADKRAMLPAAAEKLPPTLEPFLTSLTEVVNIKAAYAEGIALQIHG